MATIILGPLTTTWTPPPACSVVVAACSTCDHGWAGQSCVGGAIVTDNPECWPPRTAGVHTPPPPNALLAWGIYKPASICPLGYSAACSYDGAAQTGDFEFEFTPRETEVAIGCCPTGYGCHKGPSQTCTQVISSSTDTIPTVTCRSGSSANMNYMTVPFAATASESTTVVEYIINTFTASAPLFQLVRDIPGVQGAGTSASLSESTPRSTSRSTSATNAASAQQISPTQTGLQAATSSAVSSQAQGLSAGASAGIGCGVGLMVLLVGVGAFLLFRSKRRKRGTQIKSTPDFPTPTDTPSYEQITVFPSYKSTAELPVYIPIAEMRTDKDPVELEGHRGVYMQPPNPNQIPWGVPR